MTALVDESWTRDVFTPAVAGREAAIIDARGASSAASAANAAIDHVHDWIHGTPTETWTSAAVVSDGSHSEYRKDSSPGFPVESWNGRYQYKIVQGLQIDESSQYNINHSVAELLEERDVVVKRDLVPTI